uniref:Uncharacterized protein n=1 Tax=Mycoplasma feriruminatoris TaxID=1179777 RepID=A0A654IF10_9MOLU|nr:hypothetical protein MF5294_00803 [Mycoplasma feriruminatoris]
MNIAGKAQIEIDLIKRTVETFVSTPTEQYKVDLNKIKKTHVKAVYKCYEDIIKNEEKAKSKLEEFKSEIQNLDKQIEEFSKQQ